MDILENICPPNKRNITYAIANISISDITYAKNKERYLFNRLVNNFLNK